MFSFSAEQLHGAVALTRPESRAPRELGAAVREALDTWTERAFCRRARRTLPSSCERDFNPFPSPGFQLGLDMSTCRTRPPSAPRRRPAVT